MHSQAVEGGHLPQVVVGWEQVAAPLLQCMSARQRALVLLAPCRRAVPCVQCVVQTGACRVALATGSHTVALPAWVACAPLGHDTCVPLL